jgi:tyrosyl-tRNA synthetase
VIILFGDFTAQIGDPTGKSDARKQLSEDQVSENVEGWISQIRPLMDFGDRENPPKILLNSEWLSKLSIKDIFSLASNFTVQQMIERDMFEKRMESNTPIYLHEFLYPLMQGYDSVAMDVDIELCGTDQIFNALAGRTLMKRLKNKDKLVVAVNLMANPKTGDLMSKSKGTGVFLSLHANEMFGAIMAQPDEMIEILFINNTRVPLSEIKDVIKYGPKMAKARVGFEIVKIFYGEEKAKSAHTEWENTFSKGGVPEGILEARVKAGTLLVDSLLANNLIESKSDFRRLVKEKAISLDGAKIENDKEECKNGVYRIGKHRFLKITVS